MKVKYLRFNLIDILSEYEISYVSIKVVEYNAQKIDTKRCFIDGVVQESLATSNILNFAVDNVQSLSKKLNISSTKYKDLISKQNLFIEYINKLDFSVSETNKEKREAALLAISNLMEK